MKKLMIIVAVAMAAIVTQAAQFNWKTGASSATGPIVLPSSVTTAGGSLSSATAYLFATGTGSTAQQAVLDAFLAGTFTGAGALDSQTMANTGKIAAGTAFTYGGEGQAATLTAFFAVVQTINKQDYIFISDNVTAAGSATGTKQLSFTAREAGANLTSFKPDQTPKSFGTAGWYTQGVPEPTSGLLLLVGMAGLALRRRRA